MEAEQPPIEWSDFFRKDNIQHKNLKDISTTAQELYLSILKDRDTFKNPLNSRGERQHPRYALEPLIAHHKDETSKAHEVVVRLYSEMKLIAARVGQERNLFCQRLKDDGSNIRCRDIDTYFGTWVQVLWFVKRFFLTMEEKAKQMEGFWERMDISTTAEEMRYERDDEAAEVFDEVLAERIRSFGPQDVEYFLDLYHDEKAQESHEADMKQKKSDTERVVKKTRKEFEKVVDGLKKEMEEIKAESKGLKSELEALKRGGRA